jgi:Cytochrome C'
MAQHRMLLFVIVAVLIRSQLTAAQASLQARPMPILENVELMDLMLKPAYDGLRHAIAAPPSDRKAWAELYERAARLAEVENLLFFRTRAGEARQAEWSDKAARARDASSAVAAAALQALRGTPAADIDRVRAIFPAISASCTACHRAFAREAPVIKP